MWRKLCIQHRILLSYGLLLLLGFGLSAFLIWQVSRFNQRVQQIQASLVHEVNTSVALTEYLVVAQNAVERYLQQPQTRNLLAAQVALNHFSAELDQSRQILTRVDQQQRLEQMTDLNAAYVASFESLRRLLSQQEPVRDSLSSQLAQASTLLDGMLEDYLRTNALAFDVQVVEDIMMAQEHVRTANYLVLRMTPLDARQLGGAAQNELNQATQMLTNQRDALANSANNAFDNSLSTIRLSDAGILQIIQTLEQVERQRVGLINEPGARLYQDVIAIQQQALESLNQTTVALEQQTRQTQSIAGLAMVITPLLALVIGIGLSHTITRPINTLVDATTRLHEGDYDVVVPMYDQQENGLLAAAFNRMTATLKEQRDSLLEQQATLVQRNQELEQALGDIRVATAARDDLARTVRQLSVPIIPILDHVIVLPLIGEIDAVRAQDLIQQLLMGVSAHRARLAILDVTGVPVVDDLVAHVILEATRAVGLLGARCILVGVGPETAQALVATGANLSQLQAHIDLRSAVAYALQMTSSQAILP